MTEKQKKLNVEEWLFGVAVVFIVGGVAVYSWPAALILFGVLCMSAAVTIGAVRAVAQKEKAARESAQHRRGQ